MRRIAAVVFALVVIGAVVLVLTRSGDRPPSKYQVMYDATCAAYFDAKEGHPARARTTFFDGAHVQIHALASAAEFYGQRAGVARLLEAKQAVEVAFGEPGPELAPRLQRLTREIRNVAAALDAPVVKGECA